MTGVQTCALPIYDPRNVLLNEMNKPFTEYALDNAAMGTWGELVKIRDTVNGALEAARNEKKIGKSLEAEVELTVPTTLARQMSMDAEELADLLIVSGVTVSTGEAASVQVKPAQGAKCERCWKILPSVGKDSEHPGLCGRCAKVVRKLDIAF